MNLIKGNIYELSTHLRTERSSIGNVPCNRTCSPRFESGPRLPSPRLSTGARIFLDLFQDFIDAVLSMVANSEVCMMILSISRTCRLSLPEVLIWVGCMCVFMEVSVCTCL